MDDGFHFPSVQIRCNGRVICRRVIIARAIVCQEGGHDIAPQPAAGSHCAPTAIIGRNGDLCTVGQRCKHPGRRGSCLAEVHRTAAGRYGYDRRAVGHTRHLAGIAAGQLQEIRGSPPRQSAVLHIRPRALNTEYTKDGSAGNGRNHTAVQSGDAAQIQRAITVDRRPLADLRRRFVGCLRRRAIEPQRAGGHIAHNAAQPDHRPGP